MARIERGRRLSKWKCNQSRPDGGKLRIVGGRFKGQQISYLGEVGTRPMKDNVREALFNLVGGWVPGKAAFDLFAGTGAVGLEALSRGASKAFLVERHIPTVRLIRENVRVLDRELPAEIVSSDTFFWVREFLADPVKWPLEPWIVFCCPPYDLFVEQLDDLLEMIKGLIDVAPADSLFIVESDNRFDPGKLPDSDRWRVRQYAPALISVLRPGESMP